MSPDQPGSIEDLALERAAARARRDWSKADRLRAAIEEAGWKVIDQGIDFRLEPARSGTSVPTRLDEPATDPVSVVLIAPDRADALAPTLLNLHEGDQHDRALVIVANAPAGEMAEALADPGVAGSAEVLWLDERLSPAAAANAGLRRTSGSVIVLLDERTRPNGDVVTPLVSTLEDPAVAVAGAFGLASADIRRWEPAGPGEVDALAWGALAFRRDDLKERGPLEERFNLRGMLGPWWSLVLRDEGPDSPPRRAMALPLPLDVNHAADDDPALARAGKRDLYRLIDRFGHRYDLLRSPAPNGRSASEPR